MEAVRRADLVDASVTGAANAGGGGATPGYRRRMGTPLYWVDAFTDTPYRGNPAAICLLDAPLDEPAMQSLAFELGLAETAYVVGRADGDYDLRWFTPTVEIPLCGHATLASAHTLFETGRAADAVTFHTKSGPLTCTRDGARIAMDFPAARPTPVATPPGLLEALGVSEAVAVLDNKQWFIVEVADPRVVEGLAPDL